MSIIPRLMIAAPLSGSGKSVITTGLMSAFSKQFPVQGFKVGPDYIDPMYHTAATGRPSRNLDSWMLSPATVKQLFAHASQGASLSIIEGVMGLFDGHGSDPFVGSSAGMAVLLECPVILVLDCSKMSGSAAAIVHGMDTFSDSLRLSGVICNRVASENHSRWLKEAIETYTDIPFLGAVPRLAMLQVPERHLGLFTVAEKPEAAIEFIEQAAEIIDQYINLDRIWAIANKANSFRFTQIPEGPKENPSVRLAIARDEAFCFYYEDNLDSLRQCGAQIVPFSPLDDETLPESIHGIYFGGGYPELYAERLSQNAALRRLILNYSQHGMPIYAECGGLMYLTEGLLVENANYPMAGIVPGWCEMGRKLIMGYREMEATSSNLLTPDKNILRGHEFHYSQWHPTQNIGAAWMVHLRNRTDQVEPEGYAKDNILASYIHLHFSLDHQIARNFVNQCLAWKNTNLTFRSPSE